MTFEEAIEAEVERAMEYVRADFDDRIRNHLDLMFGSRKHPRELLGIRAFFEELIPAPEPDRPEA